MICTYMHVHMYVRMYVRTYRHILSISLYVYVCYVLNLFFRIDHWDVERERILLVTGKNLCSIRYDFISQVVSEIRTVPLVLIDELVYGEITYPKLSAGQ